MIQNNLDFEIALYPYELVTYGEFRELDLSQLGYERIERGEPFLEKAVI